MAEMQSADEPTLLTLNQFGKDDQRSLPMTCVAQIPTGLDRRWIVTLSPVDTFGDTSVVDSFEVRPVEIQYRPLPIMAQAPHGVVGLKVRGVSRWPDWGTVATNGAKLLKPPWAPDQSTPVSAAWQFMQQTAEGLKERPGKRELKCAFADPKAYYELWALVWIAAARAARVEVPSLHEVLEMYLDHWLQPAFSDPNDPARPANVAALRSLLKPYRRRRRNP